MIRQLFGRKFWKGGYRPRDQAYRSPGIRLSSQGQTQGRNKRSDPYSLTNLDVDDSTEEIVKEDNTFDKLDHNSNVISVENSFKVEILDGEAQARGSSTTYPFNDRPWTTTTTAV